MPISTTATVRPCHLDDVLVQVRAMLVAGLRWPEERVLTLDPESVAAPPPQGDQVCYLWPEDESLDVNSFDGAGRIDTRDTVLLGVELLTRLATDPRGDATLALLDRQRGHLRVRHAVYNAVAGRTPRDAAGNDLTDRPIRPHRGGTPKRLRQTPGWTRSRWWFAVTYPMLLDQTLI